MKNNMCQCTINSKMMIRLSLLFTLVLTTSSCEFMSIMSIIMSGDLPGEYYVPAEILTDAGKPTFKPSGPIARELKLFYVTRFESNGKEIPSLVYDNGKVYQASAKQLNVPALDLANKIKIKQSDIFTKQAKLASKRGDHASAKDFHELAIGAAESEQAHERAMASVDLMVASVSMFKARMEQNLIISHTINAQKIIDYLKNDLSVIGNKAPKGSVLHVYLQKSSVIALNPLRFKHTSNFVLTLKKMKGKIVNSAVEQVWYLIDGKPSNEFMPPKNYKMYKSKYADQQTKQVKENYFRHHLIASATKELYRINKAMKKIRK